MNQLAIVALLKRLRTQIGRGEHRSALWETLDLVDVAIEAPAPPSSCPPGCEGCALHVAVLAGEPSAPPAPEMPAALPATQPAPESTHQASEATGGAELSLAERIVEALDEEPPSEEEVAEAVASLDIPKLASMLRAHVAAHPEIREVGERLEATLASLPPHARQQAATARPDDACKCAYRDGGHRVVSRWCELHGAAWQTLAEQRAGDVQGSPELEPSERGLR